MTGIDEVSRSLGELQADAKSAQRQRAEIFDQLKEANKGLAMLPEMMEKMKSQDAAIKKNGERINNLEKFNIKAVGFIAGVSVIGGAVSHFATKYFFVWMK